MAKCNWEPFFEEFTDIILSYKNNRKELIEKLREMYRLSGVNWPNCGSDENSNEITLENSAIDNLDPFTILTFMIDGSGIIRNNSNAAHDVFHMTHSFPNDYDGMGIPFSIKKGQKRISWFFINRTNENDERMNYLWDLFECAVLLRRNYTSNENRNNFIKYYNNFKKIISKGFNVPTMTSLLSLIGPCNYVWLNDVNINYIKNEFPSLKNLLDDNNTFNGEKYLDLNEALNNELKNFDEAKTLTELSYNAYISQPKKPKGRKKKGLESQINYDVDNASALSTNFSDTKSGSGTNKIYYGIPGCGKSHLIDDQLKSKHIERVVFHPDYMYSDFVGQILPVVVNDKIKYEFVPGPFTQILGEAFKHRDTEYYLIIEELNRGNAPAIFGDIFQLLDRDETGNSRYRIVNKDIEDCIKKEQKIELKEIYIPSNLSIYATMNTADQNVFTLDTAFQRRWVMEYVPDDIDSCELASIHIGGNDENMTWKEFHDSVNELISSSRSSVVTDDKRLGSYFCSENELNDLKLFANKVLKYLYDDAFKLRRNEIFTSDIKNFDSLMAKIPTGENTSFDFSTIIKFTNKD